MPAIKLSDLNLDAALPEDSTIITVHGVRFPDGTVLWETIGTDRYVDLSKILGAVHRLSKDGELYPASVAALQNKWREACQQWHTPYTELVILKRLLVITSLKPETIDV